MKKIPLSLIAALSKAPAYSPVVWTGTDLIVSEDQEINLNVMSQLLRQLSSTQSNLSADMSEQQGQMQQLQDLTEAQTKRFSELFDKVAVISQDYQPIKLKLSRLDSRVGAVEQTATESQLAIEELNLVTELLKSGALLSGLKGIEIDRTSTGNYTVGISGLPDGLIVAGDQIAVEYDKVTGTYSISGALPDLADFLKSGNGIKVEVEGSGAVRIGVASNLVQASRGIVARRAGNGTFMISPSHDLIQGSANGGIEIERQSNGSFVVSLRSDLYQNINRKIAAGFGLRLSNTNVLSLDRSALPKYKGVRGIKLQQVGISPNELYEISFDASTADMPKPKPLVGFNHVTVEESVDGTEIRVGIDENFLSVLTDGQKASENAIKSLSTELRSLGWKNFSPELKAMLACPTLKLLSYVNGSMKAEYGRGNADDAALADKFGLQPVRKLIYVDLIPTASYAGIGGGTAFGVETQFDLYKALERDLAKELGKNSFAIKSYEKGKKYRIDDIDVGNLEKEVVTRSDLPQIVKSTGFLVFYPAMTGHNTQTYPNLQYMASILDFEWMIAVNLSLPSGWAATNPIKTTNIQVTEDVNAQTRSFKHTVQDPYTGSTYTTIWRRPMLVSNQNTEFMTLVDAGGAPLHVQAFTRMYAVWKYNDYDCMAVLHQSVLGVNDVGGGNKPVFRGWASWGGLSDPKYLANVGYTANLAFDARVYDLNKESGDAKLKIDITSGSIGYSYFPANMLVKKLRLPVTYTLYPGLTVNADGTTDMLLQPDDIFNSCCWGDFEKSVKLDCSKANPGSGGSEPVPPVVPPVSLCEILVNNNG